MFGHELLILSLINIYATLSFIHPNQFVYKNFSLTIYIYIYIYKEYKDSQKFIHQIEARIYIYIYIYIFIYLEYRP